MSTKKPKPSASAERRFFSIGEVVREFHMAPAKVEVALDESDENPSDLADRIVKQAFSGRSFVRGCR